MYIHRSSHVEHFSQLIHVYHAAAIAIADLGDTWKRVLKKQSII